MQHPAAVDDVGVERRVALLDHRGAAGEANELRRLREAGPLLGREVVEDGKRGELLLAYRHDEPAREKDCMVGRLSYRPGGGAARRGRHRCGAAESGERHGELAECEHRGR